MVPVPSPWCSRGVEFILSPVRRARARLGRATVLCGAESTMPNYWAQGFSLRAAEPSPRWPMRRAKLHVMDVAHSSACGVPQIADGPSLPVELSGTIFGSKHSDLLCMKDYLTRENQTFPGASPVVLRDDYLVAAVASVRGSSQWRPNGPCPRPRLWDGMEVTGM